MILELFPERIRLGQPFFRIRVLRQILLTGCHSL